VQREPPEPLYGGEYLARPTVPATCLVGASGWILETVPIWEQRRSDVDTHLTNSRQPSRKRHPRRMISQRYISPSKRASARSPRGFRTPADDRGRAQAVQS
jgi:hypothetical protein